MSEQTSSDIVTSSEVKTSSEEFINNTSPVITSFEASRAESLEDLIPIELRKVFQETKKQDDPVVEPVVEKTTEKDTVPENLEKVDLSTESIEKLLKGDFSEPETKQEEEKPFWYEDEDYKELTSRLENYGLKDQAIDKVLKKVADRYEIDSGKLVQGLTSQLEEAKKKADVLEAEQKRLRDLERSVLFDQLEETKTKYGAPMIEAVEDIKNVLTREGSKISVNQILQAKNKVELLNLVEGLGLPEKDLVRVMEQWRTYKDTETAYSAAKTEAREKGIGAVTAKISDTTIETIFKNGLRSLIKSRDDYGYIDKAISSGIDKSPEVGNVIGMGKTNAFTFIKALQNPTEHLHSEQWMEGLVKYTLDSAHNKYLADQVPKLRARTSELEENLAKVIVEYKKLAVAAKGLNGSKSPGFIRNAENDSSKSELNSKEVLEQFAKGDYSKLLERIPSLRE
jgi:hypothetical protein